MLVRTRACSKHSKILRPIILQDGYIGALKAYRMEGLLGVSCCLDL